MGTNYYVYAPPSCGGTCTVHCRGSEIHLGKSSAGWDFSFRAYPVPGTDIPDGLVSEPVMDFASWCKLLDLGEIRDEYSQVITSEDLMAKIGAKRGGRSTLYRGDFHDEAGHRFTPEYFS